MVQPQPQDMVINAPLVVPLELDYDNSDVNVSMSNLSINATCSASTSAASISATQLTTAVVEANKAQAAKRIACDTTNSNATFSASSSAAASDNNVSTAGARKILKTKLHQVINEKKASAAASSNAAKNDKDLQDERKAYNKMLKNYMTELNVL